MYKLWQILNVRFSKMVRYLQWSSPNCLRPSQLHTHNSRSQHSTSPNWSLMCWLALQISLMITDLQCSASVMQCLHKGGSALQISALYILSKIWWYHDVVLNPQSICLFILCKMWTTWWTHNQSMHLIV